jgi:hypothetical protein
MIKAYHVLVAGEPFLLDRDGASDQFGFYRNEYLLSSSAEGAIHTAKARALKKLARKHVRFLDDQPLELRVEEVKEGVSLWRLFASEGFIFFPIDSN